MIQIFILQFNHQYRFYLNHWKSVLINYFIIIQKYGCLTDKMFLIA